ncbi:PREDICTED: phytanoyl-CoA dioxygenase, peroxisomal-like [Vollenhovia emeryi]|uniref:phytanoyl-CoA dioxygenase, peroxisomal-like n=1 Tax=Vollenhovia emeryi TaxID=411798 RepID=UPI0005F48CC5|nr:PREDICTED: phytanoyl-CoA dioxygenase, peroxisomal-like [Vollenhovia emeryi]XP_011861633.1 PREDICTED: phytanoyl-CoA dioxygenase, peroxisomal-like [Vollenhovia emeryi]XP_011861635.1 PREDICTED: phytanoyl-CoA dioxygenase, peroxisomal-like [Vollenhovia emeryi]XP_011861636.1 PREDICTED: phytanoyl-CoA dioxygenase, peroxisomal-like [Vollenhovia emeryi]XP_011861637.1 PREDICTED: phytanoyl-CoA dioxygenase, peroxisomal-like [Vollenhovia emeryi]XP_011861638.1 PREDICTED: phytanoyl-CoA dioxygenase, peroxis
MTSDFRYTKDVLHRLSPEQRLFYEKNGYLVFPRLISQDIINICHQRFDEIVEGKTSRDGIIVMYDVKDRKSVNKIQEIHTDPVFRRYMEHEKILDIVECFTGPNILAIHSMLIAKPPDVGFGTSRHPPHQDLYYFPLRPADHIVAAWTAMEPCDSENGCLYVAPGTHALGTMFPHDYPPKSEGEVNKFYHGIHQLPALLNHWVNLEMQPGDTVFFHPLLIHGSGVNKSQRTRRAISCHYAATDCNIVDDDPRQDTIRGEILELLKKRYPNMEITYADLWRFKSSLVRGLRSSF